MIAGHPTLRDAGFPRELWAGFLLAVDDFAGLLLLFFFAVCLVDLCVDCLGLGAGDAGAGATLAGAGAGVPAAACAKASDDKTLTAKKERIANAETSVFIRGSWVEMAIRSFSRTC
jgi:hypothetical protein